MTRVTVPGSDIRPRCPASYSDTIECAWVAMARCELAGMILSFNPMRYQDGISFHAGTPEGSARPAKPAGRWVAHTRFFSSALNPVANDANTTDFLRYRSVSGVGGNAAGTKSNNVVGSPANAESGPRSPAGDWP